MANVYKIIITPSDKQIKDMFVLLMKQTQSEANFSIGGFANSLSVNDDNFLKLVSADANLITSASIQGTGFSINLQARCINSTSQGSVPHPYYSTILLITNDGYGQQTQPDLDLLQIAK